MKTSLIPADELEVSAHLELFQSFDNKNGHKVSNLFPLYDLLPRGIYSYRQMSTMRDANGGIGPVEKTFTIREQNSDITHNYSVTFYPAQINRKRCPIKDKDLPANKIPSDDYFIGPAEVLIEEMLKYMACKREYAACLSSEGYSIVIEFSFRDLQKELKEIGSPMKVGEIRKSLQILSRANFKIEGLESSKYDFEGSIIDNMFLVNRKAFNENNSLRNQVTLSRHISKNLSTGAYQQVNFGMLMGNGRDNLLANYLSKRLFIRYINATMWPKSPDDQRGTYYDISLTTLHSATKMLNYATIYKSKQALENVFKSLIAKGLIFKWELLNKVLENGKAIDFVYRLHPTKGFCFSQIASNRRKKEITEPGINKIQALNNS